jgi:protein subunit release factor B
MYMCVKERKKEERERERERERESKREKGLLNQVTSLGPQ